jgi:hypothetical protein
VDGCRARLSSRSARFERADTTAGYEPRKTVGPHVAVRETVGGRASSQHQRWAEGPNIDLSSRSLARAGRANGTSSHRPAAPTDGYHRARQVALSGLRQDGMVGSIALVASGAAIVVVGIYFWSRPEKEPGTGYWGEK